MFLIGNALNELRKIEDESVDCVVTSPPYYLLREYNVASVWDEEEGCEHEWEEEKAIKVREDFSKAIVDNNKKGLDLQQVKKLGKFCSKCGAWYGELGHEPSPELYIKHLADIFDEVRRVLKSEGNCFIIIGDTYAGGGGTTTAYGQTWEVNASHRPNNRLSQKIVGTQNWIKRKQLLLIPYRLAIELQIRDWIIRDIIIWAKKVAFVDREGDVKEQVGNGLPESVKDRLTKSYEVIIHAVKSERYYFNKPKTIMKTRPLMGPSENYKGKFSQTEDSEVFSSLRAKFLQTNSKFKEYNRACGSIAGRVINNLLEGKEMTRTRKALVDVNEYLKQKLKEKGYTIQELVKLTGIKESTLAHYFRTDLSGRALPDKEVWLVLQSYLELGEYEEFINEEIKSVIPEFDGQSFVCNVLQANTEPFRDAHFAVMPTKLVRFLIKMGCPKGGVVLDPFLGSGTTALVAEELGRKWIGIEFNREYTEIIKQRLKDVQRKLFV